MSLTEYPGFIGQTYTAASLHVDAERAINLLPEAGQGNTRSKLFYYARPGLALATQLDPTIKEVNALYTTGSFNSYAIQQRGFYKLVNTSGAISSTKIANLAPQNYDRLSLASSQSQLLIAQGNSGYIWDGSSLTAIGDPGFLGGTSFTQIKGYFVGLGEGVYANRLYSSDLLNGLSWPGANYALVNSPDPPVAITTDQRELLWVFCQNHIQVYAFNSSLTAFPFSTIDGAVMQVGLLARLSLCAVDNTLFWLGSDDRGIGGVYRASGFTPQKVSTPAVDQAISAYVRVNGLTQLSAAESYCYRDGGHEFYIMTVGGQTWAYDASTDLWTERSFWDAASGLEKAHLARNHTYNASWNMHLCGDYQSANIYQQDASFLDDNGSVIRRRRTAPCLWTGGNRNFFARMQLDMQVGSLLRDDSGQIIAPQVGLRWSDDGGNTYRSQYLVSSGKVGEFQTRVIWRSLGSSFQRNFEVVQTDRVPTAWTGAWLDMSQAPIKLTAAA